MRRTIQNTITAKVTLRALLLFFTGGLVLVLLAISMAVSFDRFRNYMALELEGRTRDAATAVGLSLSNAVDATDTVAVSRLIDAIFDSGDYLLVEFVDHDQQRIAGVERVLALDDVPRWFMDIVDLPLPVGEADVTNGWSWLGTVRVVGNPGRAYRDLWKTTLWLTVAAVVVGVCAIGFLHILLGRLLAPLRTLETQAEAISRRNFRRRTSLRSTRELNQVISAMNQMTDDLEQLFAGQAALIGHLRKLNNEDTLTSLATRNAFDQRLAVEVASRGEWKPGSLILIQVSRFAELNQRLGRPEADHLLVTLAEGLQTFTRQHAGSFAGRRSGAEFAVFIPGGAASDAQLWGSELVDRLQLACNEFAGDSRQSNGLAVHAGVAGVEPGATVRALFEAADEALRQAQAAGTSGCHLGESGDQSHHGAEEWRKLLSRALDNEEIWLWSQPMVPASGGSELYRQMFSRLRIEREWIQGNVFVPIAERYGLMAQLDLMVAGRVINYLKRNPGAVAGFSLGMSSVGTPGFADKLLEQFTGAAGATQRLWISMPEQAVHYQRPKAQALLRRLRRTGARLLVDRFGVGGIPFSYMKNLPVQAVCIDPSFVHGIDRHDENRFFLESVTTIAHGRGVQVFASGVETESEWHALTAAGVDAGIGYHLGRPAPANGASGAH